MYAYGLERAAATLSQLETRADFRHFLSRERRQGRTMSLVDFIRRPLKHLEALCDVAAAIEKTTIHGSRDQTAFSKIVQGALYKIDFIKFSCYQISL
ncbi:hypothetical protein DPMN_081317 [Dreissena polymorpha]|uniref:Uncharacterized protein n=1 Tax=Dreissena polymorpha TaxID=45954 RepID=A0A9D4BHM8_DREPO|nr:hypothetical protein DPMN_081317 [Dreissena polymorpha]